MFNSALQAAGAIFQAWLLARRALQPFLTQITGLQGGKARHPVPGHLHPVPEGCKEPGLQLACGPSSSLLVWGCWRVGKQRQLMPWR